MTIAIAPARAVVVIVDVQERLAAAMPAQPMAQLARNVGILLEMARRLSVPVVVSRQYPKGLGPTVPEIAAAIERCQAEVPVHHLDKIEFSAPQAPAFSAIANQLGPVRDQWIVTGMETHVCVYQTVRDLCERGNSVHVPQDAVCSRTKPNWQVGLRVAERAGAIVSSTEVVVFDALMRAGSDDFKALSRLIK